MSNLGPTLSNPSFENFWFQFYWFLELVPFMFSMLHGFKVLHSYRVKFVAGVGPGGTPALVSTGGTGGRGERLNAVQKERLKLLTTAAFDRGKEEDTFGMHDEDWQLYKRMSKDADDVDEADDEDAELARLTSRLQVLIALHILQVAAHSQ